MTNTQQLFNRAVQAHRAGQPEQAITLYNQVLAQHPQHVDSLHLLGMLYTKQGKIPQAISLIEQAITQNPQVPNFYNSLGNALRAQADYQKALRAYQQAITLKPDYAEAHGNLAIIQKQLHHPDEAIFHYEQAVTLDPKLYTAYYNLGNCYGEIGRIGDSIAAYRQAIEQKPDYADAQQNLAHALLLEGKWTEGWQRYEWRFAQSVPWRDYGKPLWQGQPLEGKTLLIQWEQGYGDTFQFVRFLSQLSKLDGKVIFECQPGLSRLLQDCPFIEHLVEGSCDGTAPQIPFDVCFSLMSLPRLLNLQATDLSSGIPYLYPDPELAAHWKNRLQGSKELKVGMVWASNPHVEDRLGRSCQLTDFQALMNIPNIIWYSLQKGVAADDTAIPITHLGLQLTDFAETAAVIANLDLVITVDTSVAHLAGAMGKPTWTLLTYVPNWRWLLDRTDTPWYPSMRLFRQKTSGSWSSVFEEVRQALLTETRLAY